MRRTTLSKDRSVALQVEALEARCLPSTAEYVTGLYGAILHRAPSPAEVAGWVNTLNAGASPQEVALAFTNSLEYSTNMIRADYTLILDRQPAPVEVAGWLQQLQAGIGEKQVEARFLASDEFFSHQGGSAVPWLKGVYAKALGRSADSVGLATWSQSLQAGLSRAAVALAIVDSPEADSRLVASVYLDLLRRNPDAFGLTAWVAKLQQGLPPSDLVASIASSDEFIALTAHGTLDMPNAPSAPDNSSVEPSISVEPFCNPFIGDPFCGTPTVVIDPGQSDTTTCDPGIDSSTLDNGSNDSSTIATFDGAGSDCGDGSSDTSSDTGQDS